MADDSDLHFHVYSVRNGHDQPAERQRVASFGRYIEAEVFIHSELRGRTSRGTDTARFWGADGDGRHVHYWIESPQVAASATAAGKLASA